MVSSMLSTMGNEGECTTDITMHETTYENGKGPD